MNSKAIIDSFDAKKWWMNFPTKPALVIGQRVRLNNKAESDFFRGKCGTIKWIETIGKRDPVVGIQIDNLRSNEDKDGFFYFWSYKLDLI